MRKTLVCVVVALAFAGCSKKNNEQTAKQAKLCQDADKLMREINPDTDKDGSEMQTAMEGGMLACSQACDGGDQKSCESLHGFTGALCKVTPSACEQLCGTVKSPSLKKDVCAAKSN
jgi:hypothetical protein